MDERLLGCQTCGLPKFCVYCGNSTEKMKATNMVPQNPRANYMQPFLETKASAPMYTQDVGCGDPMQSTMSIPQLMQLAMQAGVATASPNSPVTMPDGMMMSLCVPVGGANYQQQNMVPVMMAPQMQQGYM